MLSSDKNNESQRQFLFGVVYVCLLAMLVLLVSAPLVGINRLHFGPPDRHLNDQVGYIAAARNLVDSGRLDANIVYPSTLYQETSKNILYLPGHYYALAISYTLFGFGVLQSYLPNLIAFILGAICVYLIGSKLYQARIGFIAALVFIFFPLNILYAFTAMSEMTLVLMAALAICIFIYLPKGVKPYIGPLCLIPPLLFRETALFLTIPMAVMIYDFKKKNISTVLVHLIISIIVAFLILRSPIASGRPSLLVGNIFDDRFETLYQDAVALNSINPKLLDWVPAIASKFMSNLQFLVNPIIHFDLSFDLILFYAVLAMMVIELVLGVLKREIFLLSAGSFILAIFVAILSFYAIYSYRGLRVILITLPIAVVGMAVIYDKYIENLLIFQKARLIRALPYFLIVTLACISLFSVGFMSNRFRAMDPIDDQHLIFMEEIGHDDQTLLAAPFELALYYVYRHYPVRYSFLPKNPPTLELLAERFKIGTIVLPLEEYREFFSAGDFERYGLFRKEVVQYAGEDYLICQAKPNTSTLGALIK